MRGNKKINVLYDERLVGTIAEISNRKTAFETKRKGSVRIYIA